MNLKALLTRFAADESGAVTVDWVVLTAGLVGLAAIIGVTVADGVQNAGNAISDGLADEQLGWDPTNPEG